MRNLALLITLLATLTSLQAGLMDKVKIKKAVAAAEEKVQTELTKVKNACGNQSLSVSVDWDKWASYKLSATKHEQTIGYVGNLIVNEVFGAMTDACKDADYKEVIAQIQKIAITGKDNFSDMYIDFKYNNGTLETKLNGDGYGSWKNKELFMEAW